MAVRRSTRLKAKERDRVDEVVRLGTKIRSPGIKRTTSRTISSVATNSSSDSERESRDAWVEGSGKHEREDSDTDLFVVTPNKTSSAHKTNNFVKVHNSYNNDYGLDVYGGGFIDDRDLYTNYTPKPRRKRPTKMRKEKQRRLSFASATDSSPDDTDRSSSPVVSQRSRRKIAVKYLSSGESDTSNHGNNLVGDTEVQVVNDIAGEHSQGTRESANFSLTKTGQHTLSLDQELSESSVPMSLSPQLESPPSLDGGNLAKRRGVSEDSTADGCLGIKRRSRSLHSDSSEEDAEKTLKATKKKKRLRRPESDDEISLFSETPVRHTSSRAEKLKREKQLKREQLLEKLKKHCDGVSCSSHSGEDTDTVTDAKENVSQETTAVCEEPATDWSLAESILFPLDDSSSDDSDWIVSDDDLDEVNVDMLCVGNVVSPRQLESPVGHKESGEDVRVLQEEILLEAVSCEASVSELIEILPEAKDVINTARSQGRTPLMLAALRGNNNALQLLIQHGANVNCHDFSKTTALHLAALSGSVDCVNTLIAHGHNIECRDAKGWSPLLYAHFGNHHDCVLTLMRACPQQLSVLRDLLKGAPEEGTEARRKTVRVVRSLLVSLAHHEAYYSLFNDFIRHNLTVLDDDGFGFMRHCMALLSFENKQAWLRDKLKQLKEYAAVAMDQNTYSQLDGVTLCDIPREGILEAVRKRLSKLVNSPQRFWLKSLFVTFRGESGICSGPRKEFWSCLSQAISKDEKLFRQTDEGNLSLHPCSIFSKYCYSVVTPTCCHEHNQLLHIIGMMTAFSVFHSDTMDINLSKPLLKRLVGLTLNHPDDLEDVDQALYHTITTCLREGVNDLDLTFTTTLLCPWSGRTVDVPIKEEGRRLIVTDNNQDDYISCLSKFIIDSSVRQETDSFLSGFWKVIPQKCLEVFKPNELSLLISGIPSINVTDWYNHTQYRGLRSTDETIVWFWKLVRSLKEEEKALLLKFATGSPRVPAGGFSQLLGLGGLTKFSITIMPGVDKVPQAATCFNNLKLSDYSCEQQLRDKVLIALRFGCEGFEFS